MAKYSYKKKKDKYVIYEGFHTLKTPGGNEIVTLYKPLADRIVLDLEKYGMNYRSASSILAWHFTMIDSFAPLDHKSIENVMAHSFLTHFDWTCRVRFSGAWSRVFGDWGTRQDDIAEWLSKITKMQLTAACCIGNAYESLNLAFVLALVLERYQGQEREEKLNFITDMIVDTYQFGTYETIYGDFKTFELYYGIHLDTDGPVLDDVDFQIDVDESDEIDVDDLSEYSVTIEQLIGRNFHHYTDCELDKKQPFELPILDIELEIYDDENDEDDCSDDDDEDEENLEDYLPSDCWVKRFVDDYDTDLCYLVYLVIDEDGNIQESGCIEETTQRIGGGSFFFTIPGMDMAGTKSYDYSICPPEKVINDLKLLFAGRVIPLDFSFIGKRLPQEMIDEGGNGGSNTEYTYALQSAYRSAYMHMSVDTDEEGIIEEFSYSSYQSSGNGYNDMFSRPVSISDRSDEAMDMLVYIYDMYTDKELKKE